MLVQNCLAWTEVADFTNREAFSVVPATTIWVRCSLLCARLLRARQAQASNASKRVYMSRAKGARVALCGADCEEAHVQCRMRRPSRRIWSMWSTQGGTCERRNRLRGPRSHGHGDGLKSDRRRTSCYWLCPAARSDEPACCARLKGRNRYWRIRSVGASACAEAPRNLFEREIEADALSYCLTNKVATFGYARCVGGCCQDGWIRRPSLRGTICDAPTLNSALPVFAITVGGTRARRVRMGIRFGKRVIELAIRWMLDKESRQLRGAHGVG
jgi:hypothetical protein